MKKILLLLAVGTAMLATSCTKDYTCTCTYPDYYGLGEPYTEVREIESANRAGANAGCPEKVVISITSSGFGATAAGTCDLDD